MVPHFGSSVHAGTSVESFGVHAVQFPKSDLSIDKPYAGTSLQFECVNLCRSECGLADGSLDDETCVSQMMHAATNPISILSRDDRLELEGQVQKLQRESKGTNGLWHRYVVDNGKVSFHPKRHSSDFLAGFLAGKFVLVHSEDHASGDHGNLVDAICGTEAPPATEAELVRVSDDWGT